MTKRLLVITKCSECKHYIFDDKDKPERWGEHWCILENKKCPSEIIPRWCNLPDTKIASGFI